MLICFIFLALIHIFLVESCIVRKFPSETNGLLIDPASRKIFKDPFIYNIPKHSDSSISNSYFSNKERLISFGKADYLLFNHGDIIVQLSSSNTYSHGKFKLPLYEYLDTFKNISSKFANESLYFFGNNYEGIWAEISDLYSIPNCPLCEKAGMKALGLAGPQSGVSFHVHGPGYSESIIGRKHWFLFNETVRHLVMDIFHPNLTMHDWFETYYPLLKYTQSLKDHLNEKIVDFSLFSFPFELPRSITMEDWFNIAFNMYDCIISPGEILYFPPMWPHATLNLDDYNLFFSVFIDEQLIS